MNSNAEPPTVEALLSHAGFIRSLARRLLRDDDLAEDVVQDALVVALETPPRRLDQLRAWLGAVARNLVRRQQRTSVRREQRESAVARVQTTPAAVTVASRLETERRLVRAVWDLVEPGRSVVVLRYYDGLGPTAIAERLDVPVRTVESRLRRALGTLRKRLDSDGGGDRSAWTRALIPLAAPGAMAKTAAVSASGALVMSTSTKIALGAMVLLLATLAIWRSAVPTPGTHPADRHETKAADAADPAAMAELPGPSSPSPSRPDGTAVAAGTRPGARTLVLTGRVVDQRRFTVGAAEVTLRFPDGTGETRRTGPDGRFLFSIDRSEGRGGRGLVGVRATGPDGAVAHVGITLVGNSTQDVPVLILAAGEAIPVLVTHAGEPVEGARVIAVHARAFAAEAVTDAKGRARLPGLPHGAHVLVVRAEGNRVGRADADLPRPSKSPVRIELVTARHVSVEVVKHTGEAVSGARVTVIESRRTRMGNRRMVSEGHPIPPLPVAPTDEWGRTTVGPLHPSETHCLLLGRTPDLGRAGGSRTDRRFTLPGDVDEFRIELPRTRTVTWIVRSGERPVPADGTIVQIRPSPGCGGSRPPPTGEVRGETLTVADWPEGCWHAQAEAPDGSMAHLFVGTSYCPTTGQTLGASSGRTDGQPARPISFVAPRSLVVVLTETGGTPVSGALVSVKNAGGIPIGAPVATDGRGIARFTRLEKFGMLTASLGDIWSAFTLGSVNTANVDSRIEVTLRAEAAVRVHVKVRGSPGLPGRFGFRCAPGLVRIVEEYPKTGVVDLAVRPRKEERPQMVLMWADGFRPVRAPIQPGGPNGSLEATVEFTGAVATSRLEVAVVPPTGGPYSLSLEPAGDQRVSWLGEGTQRKGVLVFDQLLAGRYRLTDRISGLASRVFEVRANASPTKVTFDMSTLVRLHGRVEFPVGARFGQTLVETAFEDKAHSPGKRANVRPDGSFTVSIPRDRAVSLTPVHPLLAPAKDGGVVVVRGATNEVILRLTNGRTARVHLTPPPSSPFGSRTSVRLFRGAPGAEPISTHEGVLAVGLLRFGHFEPGTYTLWIDTPGYAPAVVPGVVLSEGSTDLGTVRLSRGASIRVQVKVRRGQVSPHVYVSARCLSEPGYQRDENGHGAETVVLRGLAPGRYRVTGREVPEVFVIGVDMPDPTLDETVEICGEEEVELTLDLR
jgi:RNA polymerase sigma factor (sigma-70 family)